MIHKLQIIFLFNIIKRCSVSLTISHARAEFIIMRHIGRIQAPGFLLILKGFSIDTFGVGKFCLLKLNVRGLVIIMNSYDNDEDVKMKIADLGLWQMTIHESRG